MAKQDGSWRSHHILCSGTPSFSTYTNASSPSASLLIRYCSRWANTPLGAAPAGAPTVGYPSVNNMQPTCRRRDTRLPAGERGHAPGKYWLPACCCCLEHGNS